MDAEPYFCAVRVEARLPGVTTLKERRAVVRSVLTRMRQRCNVSASDLCGGEPAVNRAVLAVSAVSNSVARARAEVETALALLRADDRLEIFDETEYE